MPLKPGLFKVTLLILLTTNFIPLQAQVPTQTVRGTVVDRNTGLSLPAATILLKSENYS